MNQRRSSSVARALADGEDDEIACGGCPQNVCCTESVSRKCGVYGHFHVICAWPSIIVNRTVWLDLSNARLASIRHAGVGWTLVELGVAIGHSC